MHYLKHLKERQYFRMSVYPRIDTSINIFTPLDISLIMIIILHPELKTRVEDELMLVVVGNKTDLATQRTVDTDTAKKYAVSIGASFFETSALDNTGKR